MFGNEVTRFYIKKNNIEMSDCMKGNLTHMRSMSKFEDLNIKFGISLKGEKDYD